MCVLIGSGMYLGSTHFPKALKCFKLENKKLVNVSLCELTLYIKMKSLLRMSLVFFFFLKPPHKHPYREYTLPSIYHWVQNQSCRSDSSEGLRLIRQ